MLMRHQQRNRMLLTTQVCLRLLQAVCFIKMRRHFKILFRLMQDSTAAICIMSDPQLIAVNWSKQPLKCKSHLQQIVCEHELGGYAECAVQCVRQQYVLYVMG